jgi:hypothetical protein
MLTCCWVQSRLWWPVPKQYKQVMVIGIFNEFQTNELFTMLANDLLICPKLQLRFGGTTLNRGRKMRTMVIRIPQGLHSNVYLTRLTTIMKSAWVCLLIQVSTGILGQSHHVTGFHSTTGPRWGQFLQLKLTECCAWLGVGRSAQDQRITLSFISTCPPLQLDWFIKGHMVCGLPAIHAHKIPVGILRKRVGDLTVPELPSLAEVWITGPQFRHPTTVRVGNLPGPRLPIMAKVRITGPQWHPTIVCITLSEQTQKRNVER